MSAEEPVGTATHGIRTVGVVGLGYVGLPLAMGFARAGFGVVGVDVDGELVIALNAGRSHVEDIPSAVVAAAVADGRFRASDRPADLAGCDAVFICVPTPFDASKTPDLSYIRLASEAVASVLRRGMLVVLQSTTYPGTTTEVVQPILERTGLVAGDDFGLAFSPERVDPGNATWHIANTPKVVGATTREAARRAAALLDDVMEQPGLVRIVSSPAAAEMTKLLENTYRAVNIALVNELAILAHEMRIDLWEVVEAAATKPFGFEPFRPGVGPGGHCIPVDPCYLAWKARSFDFQTKFIELAADTNLRMAPYVRSRIQDLLSRAGRPLAGARILALGASFKPGIGDVRNSRALRVVELLEEGGADVTLVDPHVRTVTVHGAVRKVADLPGSLDGYDLVAFLVAHPSWPVERIVGSGIAVFDAVDATHLPTGARGPLVERL